jgi:hypothetical protein
MTHALSHSPTSSRYALQVRIHPAFATALKKIAERELMTISVFVRHLLVERLKAEGLDPAALIGACGAGQPDHETHVS